MTKDIEKKVAAYSTTDEENFIKNMGNWFFKQRSESEKVPRIELLQRYRRALAKRVNWDEVDSYKAIHAVQNAVAKETAK